MNTILPRWSSATFLQYAGTFVALLSLLALLGVLGDSQGTGALAGYAALAVAVSVAVALRLQQAGRPLAAGLAAVVAVGSVGVLAAALAELIGLVDTGSVPLDDDFELGVLIVEAVVAAGALAALRVFGHPLLVQVAAAVGLVAALDLAQVVGDGNLVAVVALVVGAAFAVAALRLDAGPYRPHGFWLHFQGAFATGGALVWLLDGSDLGWIAIGLLALGFIAAGARLRRSVWTVAGALGLLATTGHFVENYGALAVFVPFDVGAPDSSLAGWQQALVYLGLGLVYAALGLVLSRREEVPGA